MDNCRLDSWVLDLCCDTAGVSPAVLERSKAAAVFTVDRITGFRYGLCTKTVWPCQSQCPARCSRCPKCRGTRLDLFPLAGRVEQVETVEIDGVAVDSADYELTSYRYLVPYNPGALYPFPPQGPNLAPGSVGTWSVELVQGEPVPDNVLIGASDLACQFIRFCTDPASCDIPLNAVSVTQEGISVRLDSGLDVVPTIKFLRQVYNGRSRRKTGIYDPARFPRGKVPAL